MILPLLVLAACSGDAAEDPSVHACEMVGDPGTAVTAAATLEDATPDLAVDGAPYTVTLVDGAPGYVGIEVTGDTPALLFMGLADVVAELHGPDGAAVGLPDPAPVDACAEIPEHYDLDLHEAGTWVLELGPAAVADVWLLLHEADGHAH